MATGAATTLTNADPGDCPDHNRDLKLSLVDATGHAVSLGTVRFDARGRIHQRVTIPADFAPGRAHLDVQVPECEDTNASCAGFGADLTVQ